MPSDSVVGFLDRAQADRVLFPEQVEQLIRQPDIPQSDLTALCEYLLARGVLTRFQAVAIRDARGQELTFAGYPVIDEIGPCPGGIAYKALHPALRTPVVLRRIRLQWLAPDDNVRDYLNRARSFGMLIHTNVVPLLDVGMYLEELYLVIDQPSDAANLELLAAEVGGAMPGFLAAEYGRVVASALRMVHERGGVHGEIRPGNLIVGPLSMKTGTDGKERRRPAPNAIVRLAELGLVPLRPAATQLHPDRHAAAYLPPERLDSGFLGPRGDIYGLGATLYFLLTGRPPFDGIDTNDVLNRVRLMEPTSLFALRPDIPHELVGLVGRMMDKHPDHRITTAADVENALSVFCRRTAKHNSLSQAVPATNGASAPVASAQIVAIPVPDDTPLGDSVLRPAEEPVDAWGANGDTFSTVHTGNEPALRKRMVTDQERKRSRMLLILGALLHLTWISLVVLWIAGAFSSPPEPEQSSPPTKKDNPSPPKKNKKQNPNI
ncbi:MAG TPA: serine/threonine-protein kinase [Gemmata sp.]|jgi:serine/threonine protein kinase|nr:serine/threonine-protein kinase [Gemmata sp.]